MDRFLKLIGVFFATCGLNPQSLFNKNYAPCLKNGDSFDFIVVGAGSAGSAVAARLAENPKWRILLVEAGDYPGALSEVPAISPFQVGTDVDWQYKSERMDNACLGYVDQRAHWPRGKILGGSSTINIMMYTRGLPDDYDNWAKHGNIGWSWKDVEPYFKKLEKLENSTNTHYGNSGRVQLTLDDTLTPIQRTLVETGDNMGISYTKYEQSSGLYTIPFTIGEGRRCSSAKAYLKKSKIKRNLFLALNSMVTKITMENSTATGIEILINGKRLKLSATHEVILSGGVVNSPQLLMLSGIGPNKHLEELHIEVRRDLPVGENLHDHTMNLGLFVKLNPAKNGGNIFKDAIKYCIFKNGPFANNNNFKFIWSLNAESNQEGPNVQVHLGEFLQGEEFIVSAFMKIFGINNTVIQSTKGISAEHDLLFPVILLAKPKSRGKILLRSINPLDYPIIHARYLADENNEDIATLVNTVDHIKTLLNTSPLRELNPEIVYLDIPGCQGIDKKSRHYWDCHFRYMACTGLHPVGSCKMGPAADNTAVVDPRLRVRGVNRLRVVDASIMPIITSRNTNAPSIMIGERASDLIKEDYNVTHM